MVKIERRRKLTRAEWERLTSARPVVRRIPPPDTPQTPAPRRAGQPSLFSRETPTQRGGAD
jgi:hypothetical protein